ncbi:hypothetical protein EXIGLDRAFT_763255 [Exidia glandulosa HHB12029]|uniref:Protein kinase domain-containing protein n=1 Tax=Exidia glandulosa HHB12029 TaxID=1314781 RepID=A0A165M5D2_EXIGL|nr:hypothetical protein EXIGLDRAFT_763255 [Exidia glandulosa HHB12029]
MPTLLVITCDKSPYRRNLRFMQLAQNNPHTLSNDALWLCIASSMVDPMEYEGLVLAGPDIDGMASCGSKIIIKGRRGASKRLEAFWREKKTYESLEKLQGISIPKSLGLFVLRGHIQHRRAPDAALVLVHCGGLSLWESQSPQPSSLGFMSLPYTTRARIFDSIKQIHDAGFRHNALDLRCIMIRPRDGRVFITSLSRATPHSCSRNRSLCIQGIWEPRRHEYGCDELYEMRLALAIGWLPEIIRFGGRDIWMCEVQVDPARLANTAPPSWSNDKAIREAFKALSRYAKTYMTWDPEYLQFIRDIRPGVIAMYLDPETRLACRSTDIPPPPACLQEVGGHDNDNGDGDGKGDDDYISDLATSIQAL